MLKISAVYLIVKAEIPIHYTTWAPVEQALLDHIFFDASYICWFDLLSGVKNI
jgi:hypothetical protein